MIFLRHPTTILYLDDDKRQLDAIRMVLEARGKRGEFFCDKKSFLNTLEKSSSKDFISHLTIDGLTINSGDSSKIFSVNNLYKELFDSQRYKRISVVLVDYDLNDQSGLEVLKKIKDKSVYKILYTGEADEAVGIDALNKGIISAYYKKSQNIEQLVELISNGEESFFSHIDYELESLLSDDIRKYSALNSNELNNLLYKIKKQENIKELYLLDFWGSYLLISEDQEIYTLLVVPSDSVSAQLEILTDNMIYDVDKEIRSHNNFLYFYNHYPREKIKDYIFPCHYLDKANKFLFYYAKRNSLNLDIGRMKFN